ncbi:hypothetical protein V8C44DRAFT_318678 [Trichoderma aethiopicum]
MASIMDIHNTSQMLPYIHAFAFISTCAHLICAKHSHPEHSINAMHLRGISSPSNHLEAAVPTPYAARFAPQEVIHHHRQPPQLH